MTVPKSPPTQSLSAERVLQVLTRCWKSLVRSKTEEHLLKDICQTLVKAGGYSKAWVGSLEGEEPAEFKKVAEADESEGTFAITPHLSFDEREATIEASSSVIDSLRTEKFCRVADAVNGTICVQGEPPQQPRGEVMAFPLSAGSRLFGALFVQTSHSRICEEDVTLLTRLAEGLSYGLVSLCGHVEHALADADRIRLGQAVEQAAESIVITDPSGRILCVNPAFERVTGYSKAEIIGKTPRVVKSGKHNDEFYRNLWETILRGEVWNGRLLNRRKDGSIYEEEGSISPVKDAEGRIVNFVSVRRDVSRERQLELQLHQSQKMEAVGRLAGGIAHDFNNLVMVINGYGDMLLAVAKEGSLRRYGEEIKRAGERAARLTRQLLAFSRQQVLNPQLLDLNVTVASTEKKMLRRLIGEDIALETRLGSNLGCIRADPGQIGQVIMNLAVNARDAMPQGGRLLIETESIQIEAGRVATSGPVPQGRYVVLSMSDTGCGMSPEIQARMFEPFYTTKEAGKGTGLGLATAFGVVTQSGGFIECSSELGRGTTFRVYLPRLEAQPESPPAVQSRSGGTCGVETILLAEDEESVRRLVREGLRSLGYWVLEARDGREALSMAARHAGPVHLLLTDVVMPEMSGLVLAHQLSLARPQTRVLFMSGYNDDATSRHGMAPGAGLILRKPFSLQTLGARVRAVLDGCDADIPTRS